MKGHYKVWKRGGSLTQKSQRLHNLSVKKPRFSQSKFSTFFKYLSKMLLVLILLLDKSKKIALIKIGETPLFLKTVELNKTPDHVVFEMLHKSRIFRNLSGIS